jgi:hypothetical protein
MSQEELNRSGALSPEMAGLVNTAVASAVQNAVAAAFAGFAPFLKEMALTPEKLDALRTPKQTEADLKKLARELRESLKSKKDEADNLRMTAERKLACTHFYKNGHSAINLVHNFHDRQPRGTCVLCGDWIHPREWRIGPPTDTEPNGHAFCVQAHKDYQRVVTQENNR